MWVSSFAILVLCAVAAHGARLPGSKFPSWLTACYRDDPKFSDCALKNGREALPTLIKGDKKYRVPVLDPLQILEIRLDQNVTNLGVDIHLWNLTLTGLKDTVLQDLKFDLKKEYFEITSFIPKTQLLSTYKMSGKVLILPIVGTGPSNITLIDLKTVYTVNYTLVKNKKDGRDYISLKDSILSFETKRAYIKLDNLFNGDKLLGDNMNLFMNENWKELVTKVGPAIAQALGEVATQILRTVAEGVPFDEVVPLTPRKKL